MRLQEMQLVWDKLIEGENPTTEELKNLHQALIRVNKERKLSEEEEETLDRLNRLGVDGKEILSALCMIISYV